MGEMPRIVTQGRQEGSQLEGQEAHYRSLSALIADVELHNEGHGFGAIMGKTLAKAIINEPEQSGKSTEEIQKDVQTESRVETHAGLTDLRTRYGTVLSHFGFALEQEFSQFDSEMVLDTLRIKIVDVDAFTKNLGAIQMYIKDSANSPFIKMLLKSAERQVYFDSLEGISPEDQKVFSQLREISATFQKVAPDLNLKQLEVYRRFNDDGRLENYVVVEKAHLWNKQGAGFGPADWILDSVPESLDKMWQKAIDVLRQQEAKKEYGVAPELTDHLLECITLASEKLKTMPWPEKAKQEKQDVLVKYTRLLLGNQSLN